LHQGGVVERLQQLDDMLPREERNRAFGQCLDLEDLGAATSGIDVINVTDKIPRTSELDQDPGSIGPWTIKP